MNYTTFMENKEIYKKFKYMTKHYYETSIIKYHMEYEDYFQEQEIGLYKRLEKFDNEKSSLYTFMVTCVKSIHFTLYRNVKSEKNKINNIQHKFYYDNEKNNNFHDIIEGCKDVDISMEVLLEGFRKNLTDEENKIIALLIKGYSQKEINNILGFKEQQIKYKVKQIRKKLTDLVTL